MKCLPKATDASSPKRRRLNEGESVGSTPSEAKSVGLASTQRHLCSVDALRVHCHQCDGQGTCVFTEKMRRRSHSMGKSHGGFPGGRELLRRVRNNKIDRG